MTFDFDSMINYYLSQKFKLIGKCKFNHLINILTIIYQHYLVNLIQVCYLAKLNCFT
jgi:hypothetical protein